MIELKAQFDEDTRFDVPVRQTNQTRAASLSDLLRSAWPRTGSVRSRLRKIIIKHANAARIPLGFQTKTGFHFGDEPDE